MESRNLQYIEIINRLKRGTMESKVLWEHEGTSGTRYAAPLENGHNAVIASTQNGKAVVFVMSNPQGLQTLYLDTNRIGDEVLRLAVLQLYVAVRNLLADRVVNDAMDAVKNL